jgi:hypothetical protein
MATISMPTIFATKQLLLLTIIGSPYAIGIKANKSKKIPPLLHLSVSALSNSSSKELNAETREAVE